ncbi:MAG: hypothetical protein R3C59_29155 [Planctomycetaceae bacterium]
MELYRRPRPDAPRADGPLRVVAPLRVVELRAEKLRPESAFPPKPRMLPTPLAPAPARIEGTEAGGRLLRTDEPVADGWLLRIDGTEGMVAGAVPRDVRPDTALAGLIPLTVVDRPAVIPVAGLPDSMVAGLPVGPDDIRFLCTAAAAEPALSTAGDRTDGRAFAPALRGTAAGDVMLRRSDGLRPAGVPGVTRGVEAADCGTER